MTPRLQLWMSLRERVNTLKGYRQYAESSDKIDSFFAGEHFKKLKAEGLFAKDRDLAMFLSTDAVKVFKSRKEFKVQPIAAVGFPVRIIDATNTD